MPGPDPRQVISEHLGAPRVVFSNSAAPGAQGWRSQLSRGGMGADATTIQFIKDRGIPRRQVHAVVFDTTDGLRMRYTCYLAQDETDAWRFHGGAGGGADGDHLLARADPWVNLGGGGWPTNFFAGGTVLDNGQGVTRVRLTAANGTVLEDSVEDDVVLFVTDQPVELPLQAELYNRSGQVVGRHKAFKLTKRQG